MYKIDRRGGGSGGVQKSFTRTDPSKEEQTWIKIFGTKSLRIPKNTGKCKSANSGECRKHTQFSTTTKIMI